MPEFIATFMVTYEPPEPPDTLAGGSLTRTGDGEASTKEFLLVGDATYDITVDAPQDCDDFSAWLRLKGAPDRYPRLITQDVDLYLEQEELWFWDVETSCDGGWALTVRR